MKIITEKVEFDMAISAASKVLSSRTTMPVLEGILLNAENDHIKIISTDLLKSIEIDVPAMVEEPGEVLLPGKMLTEIVRKLPNERIEIYTQDTVAHIVCGKSKTHLNVMDIQDYPDLPDVDGDQTITLPQYDFKEIIRKSAFSAAQDNSRPVLTGVYLNFCQGECTMVGLDGFRMALRRIKYTSEIEDIGVIVPAASIMELGRLLSTEQDETFKLSISQTHT